MVKLKPNKHIRDYAPKTYGYTYRSNITELLKFQLSMRETYDNSTILKCIVKRKTGYAWRYYKGGAYVYHHISRPVPQYIFDKYYIQNIYASKVQFKLANDHMLID